MKKTTLALCRIVAMLFLVLCVFSIAAPAAATQTDTAPSDAIYGIDIDCRYSDMDESDSADPSIYEKNAFLLESKTSGLYAVADYRADTQSYFVVDYTDDKGNATELRCGMNREDPSELRITGIAEGIYLLHHMGTQDGYSMLLDPVEIMLSPGSATVDGQSVFIDPDAGETCAIISIELNKIFALPGNDLHPISCWSYQTFGFDIWFLVLVVVAIVCLVVLCFLIRYSRKISEFGYWLLHRLLIVIMTFLLIVTFYCISR